LKPVIFSPSCAVKGGAVEPNSGELGYARHACQQIELCRRPVWNDFKNLPPGRTPASLGRMIDKHGRQCIIGWRKSNSSIAVQTGKT
jgi:hypothetical protein